MATKTRKKKLKPLIDLSLIGKEIVVLEDLNYLGEFVAYKGDIGVVDRIIPIAGLPVIRLNRQSGNEDGCVVLWENIAINNVPCVAQFHWV